MRHPVLMRSARQNQWRHKVLMRASGQGRLVVVSLEDTTIGTQYGTQGSPRNLLPNGDSTMGRYETPFFYTLLLKC